MNNSYLTFSAETKNEIVPFLDNHKADDRLQPEQLMMILNTSVYMKCHVHTRPHTYTVIAQNPTLFVFAVGATRLFHPGILPTFSGCSSAFFTYQDPINLHRLSGFPGPGRTLKISWPHSGFVTSSPITLFLFCNHED